MDDLPLTRRKDTIDSATLRLAAVVESSDDAIISLALDGTIETWNRGAERMFGYSAAEAIGHPLASMIPPQCHAIENEVLARVRGGETVKHFESVALTRDLREMPISVTVSPLLTPDGEMIAVSRIVRDLTEQKALEREAFRLAAIVESSEDAIVSKNLAGIVQTWNHGAERIFGYTADEMIGQSILKIIPPERQTEEDEVLARICAGRSIDHFETVRRRKDGSLVDISLSVSPIRTRAGAIIGASKIARDITGQRQLARAAEDAARVRDEFLAMLSHELRTPLNAVLGYTHMLRAGHFAEVGYERAMEIIERNANILSQLVSDVLDVSRIVTGKVSLKLTAADMREIVSTAFDIIRPSADNKGVNLVFDVPADPLLVRCDPDRIQQVCWNLLSNAVKFTPPGGNVTVTTSRKDGMVTTMVSDTGVGIRAESLPHVFQRFWQGESTPGMHRSGLGLGLALARHFMELHGGTISATSGGESQGATFTITLPAAPG